MAEASICTTQFTILFLVCSSLAISPSNAKETDHFAETMDMKLLGLKEEKLSRFKLYWHEVVTGPSPSSIQIVPPPHNTSRTGFGFVRMIDNPLTIGPALSSKMVGKAKGFYAQASQEEIGLLMAMNFAFTEGKYNGSTMTVLGRNTVFSKVREMPVIGGSGVFRFASANSGKNSQV
ncbi:hypothetical protein K2173_021792 [Erythroxylum novogranatense]|uniref:Dirigent protein n=1 Tax=Erythroxylum novogranatense TaxID=1862640 RepID=A0AAV8TV76_9ROSI|nr:hypothetical protein K2173_021792 [Erythroxylum novogranatense]